MFANEKGVSTKPNCLQQITKKMLSYQHPQQNHPSHHQAELQITTQSCRRRRPVFISSTGNFGWRVCQADSEVQVPSKCKDSDIQVKPVVGIEPTTDGLQNRCSTAELNWLPGLQICLRRPPAFGK